MMPTFILLEAIGKQHLTKRIRARSVAKRPNFGRDSGLIACQVRVALNNFLWFPPKTKYPISYAESHAALTHAVFHHDLSNCLLHRIRWVYEVVPQILIHRDSAFCIVTFQIGLALKSNTASRKC